MARQQIDMRQGVSIEVVPESLGNDVIEVKSTSNPKRVYRVDTVKGRCSCPAWIFARNNSKGKKPLCKHLIAMGFKQ